MSEHATSFPVYEVVVHPTYYDGTEHDVRIAIANTEATARRLADEWILTRESPHPGNSCGCTWEARISSITLNRLETRVPLAKPSDPSMNM